MAQYKYARHLTLAEESIYDFELPPGAQAHNAGIYRCIGCGDEIAVAKGHTLPPQNHHQHLPEAGRISWQLLIRAEQKP